MNIKQSMDKCILMAHTDRSASTARTYRNGLNLLFECMIESGLKPDDDASKISIENFIEYPAWLSSKKYSKQTIGVYSSAARYYLEWLVINNYIEPPDYAQSLRYEMAYRTVVRKRSDRFVRFPQKGEAEKMLDAVNYIDYDTPIKERNIAIINFLYYTGCRNKEMANLLVKDIDLNDGSAIVTGKGEKERRVFFNERTAGLLRDYWVARKVTNPNSPAFMRHDRAIGSDIKKLTTTTIRNIVNDVCMMAGIDKGLFTPHYFRHAFAIKLLRETNNLALVQDLMGHASPASTRVYAKIYPEELKKAHKKAFDD